MNEKCNICGGVLDGHFHVIEGKIVNPGDVIINNEVLEPVDLDIDPRLFRIKRYGNS